MSDEVNDGTNETNEPMVKIGDHLVEEWIFDLYFQESAKLLDVMHAGQAGLKDGVNKDLVRAFHTLGSTSRTLGIQEVADLGYAMEALLDSLVERTEASVDFILDDNILSLINEGCSAMEEQVKRIRSKTGILDFSELTERLTESSTKWARSTPGLTDSSTSEIVVDAQNIDSGWFAASSENPFAESSDTDWLSSIENVAQETEKAVQEHALHTPAPKEPEKTEKPETAMRTESAPVTKVKVESTKTVATSMTSTKIVDASSRTSFADLPASLSKLAIPETLEDDIDPDIMTLFSEEAVDLMPQMVGLVEGWRLDNGDPNTENCRLLKRVLHTLKGSSRMAGCMRFGEFVHNLETMVEGGFSDVPRTEVPKLTALSTDILIHEMDVLMRGQQQQVIPQEQKVATSAIETGSQAVKQRPVQQKTSQMLRVSIDRLEKMSTSLAQTGMLHQRITSNLDRFDVSLGDMNENITRLHRLISEIEIQAEVQMQSQIAIKGSNFDPLEMDRFTRLQELTRMVAENMHDISMVQQNLEKALVVVSDAVAEQNMVEDDIRYEVMTSRMLPIHSLSMRLDKLIRTACRDTAKLAVLDIVGAEEIDSGVLNKVITPLEHLLRNAIAHGIESKDRRALSNKSETGRIILTVKPSGNEIIFEIKDDGAGIDPERVTKKAIEAGLIGENEKLTQEQANEMIFASGFSTSDNVSQLSGRGVGLDVVKGEISAMGGWIHVESSVGVGSKFRITVPSYMALMSTVPTLVDDVYYGIPSSLVRDIRAIPQDVLEFSYITGSLNVGDSDYPLYSFTNLVTGKTSTSISRNNTVMILEENGQFIAIHVEGILTDTNLVIRPLCHTISTIPGTVGASISGEGLPFIILNPIRMRKSAVEIEVTHGDGTTVKATKDQRKNINEILVMVVDDSLTVRKITEKFLTREGFQVCTAKDGMDALEKLQEYKPDIFLLDIEMPRMDGFELVQTLRNTDSTKSTPVVMISSRAVDKHQSHAFSLGANAYLGKPYKEDQLLAEIQKWTNHEPAQDKVKQ